MIADLSIRAVRSAPMQDLLLALNLGDIKPEQEISILNIAVLFLNSNNSTVREFGYRILVKYSIKTKKFIPLYEVASLLGFVPISNMLVSGQYLPENDGLISLLMQSYRDMFKNGSSFYTEAQHNLFAKVAESSGKSIAVIAPTSYGKSQIIEETVRDNSKKNIAIIVPSKALISQTKTRIARALSDSVSRQLTVHHDMNFNLALPLVAIMTQERLLRLYQKFSELSFDVLFVDEAHNLLSGDKRSSLLANSIIISKLRNERVAVKYLTPFLSKTDNLKLVAGKHAITEIRIDEKLKTEDYFICDLRTQGALRFYDQFMDKFYEVGKKYTSLIRFLRAKKTKKNIVYLNKPKKIESFAVALSAKKQPIQSADIDEICKEIADYVHPSYRILACLKKGVAYHHGSIPDIVRTYIENCFRSNSAISWIVTNSTLLEGINVPAEALFILDSKKGQANLTPSQFRNLVGRVNRFSEVFNPDDGSPQLLIPSIYLVGSQYSAVRANLANYLRKVAKVDRVIKDDVKNPMLAASGTSDEILEKRMVELTCIENLQPGMLQQEGIKVATTKVGRLCYAHNAFEVDLSSHELIIHDQIEEISSTGTVISTAIELMDTISDLFITRIFDNSEYSGLKRLIQPEAKKFYAMFIDWRASQFTYRQMISKFIAFWKRRQASDSIVFAGRWGNLVRDGYMENYIDVSTMSDYELINLAIVRIKEEQDFVDNNLLKFIEILNELGLIDATLYNTVKYGTNDAKQIALIRSGVSYFAANALIRNYSGYIRMDSIRGVVISSEIESAFAARNEKRIIVFEIKLSGLISPEL